jgi:hypothetical protein
MKRQLILVIQVSVIFGVFTQLPPHSIAYELQKKTNPNAPFPRWRTRNISYFINQAGSDDISMSALFPAIEASFESWSNTGTGLTFEYGGATTATADTNDHQNTLFWDEAGTIVPKHAFAATIMSWDTQTNEIIDADIAFNGSKTGKVIQTGRQCNFNLGLNLSGIPIIWNVGQQGIRGLLFNSYLLADVQATATHEIGHLLGLAHSNVVDATMSTVFISPSFYCVTDQASLEADDIAGIRFLYGSLGTIKTEATLDGVSWSGPVSYNIVGPNGVLISSAVPAETSDLLVGNYTLIYHSGGPPNSHLNAINPSTSQILNAGENIVFTLRFSSNAALTIWPMSGHDPQRTGLSSFTGPQTAPSNPSWTFTTSSPIVGDIAVSAEGNIYFASDKLYVLKPDGTSFVPPVTITSPITSPAIDESNAFVYIGLTNTSGGWDIVRYTKQLQSPTIIFTGSGAVSQLIIGNNGAVHFLYRRFPGVLSAAGPVQWTVNICPGETGRTPGSVSPGAPIIDRDGNVYVVCPEASTSKLNGQNGQTLASAGAPRNATEPMMDAQNHIWLGHQAFNGIIFFGSYGYLNSNLTQFTGSSGPAIFANSRATLLPDGSTVRWGYAFDEVVLTEQGIHGWDQSLPLPERFSSLPTADAASKIFIGSTAALYCLSSVDGSTLWRFPVSASITTQPVVSNNGAVYIGTSDGKIYAFAGAGGAICLPPGRPCASNAQCCSGLCIGGVCQ